MTKYGTESAMCLGHPVVGPSFVLLALSICGFLSMLCCWLVPWLVPRQLVLVLLWKTFEEKPTDN